TIGALDVQWQLHALAEKYLRGANDETDWLLESWSYTLEALPNKPETLIGGVDWIGKKWLLDSFVEAENLSWDDPWLESLDLEYHNIDPERGLFFGLEPAKRIGEWNNLVRQKNVTRTPPADTRARGRALAVEAFRKSGEPYVINWDSIATESRDFLVMGDPFHTYTEEVARFVRRARPRQSEK
ncbi:MAG TPA: proteasome accessory factor PafA2 family protein, partial [Chthoniobacterales bacterium]